MVKKTVWPGPSCTACDALFQFVLARLVKISSGSGIQPAGGLILVGSNHAVTVADVVVSVTAPVLLELSVKPSPNTASKASPRLLLTAVGTGLPTPEIWITAPTRGVGGVASLTTETLTTAQLGATGAAGVGYKTIDCGVVKGGSDGAVPCGVVVGAGGAVPCAVVVGEGVVVVGAGCKTTAGNGCGA